LEKKAVLQFHPAPRVQVTKVFGQQAKDLKSYHIGDIIGENQRKVLFELEVESPLDEDLKLDLCSCTLSFQCVNSLQTETYVANLAVACTDDCGIIQEDMTVLNALLVKRSGLVDREVKRLIDENKINEAIQIKEKIVGELKEFAAKSPSENITRLIQISIEGLETLKGIEKAPQQSNVKLQKPIIARRTCFDSADWAIRKTPATSQPAPKITTPVQPTLPPKQQTVYQRLPKPKLHEARKHFDSADWLASRDNKFNWEADKKSDSDSWSSDEEK